MVKSTQTPRTLGSLINLSEVLKSDASDDRNKKRQQQQHRQRQQQQHSSKRVVTKHETIRPTAKVKLNHPTVDPPVKFSEILKKDAPDTRNKKRHQQLNLSSQHGEQPPPPPQRQEQQRQPGQQQQNKHQPRADKRVATKKETNNSKVKSNQTPRTLSYLADFPKVLKRDPSDTKNRKWQQHYQQQQNIPPQHQEQPRRPPPPPAQEKTKQQHAKEPVVKAEEFPALPSISNATSKNAWGARQVPHRPTIKSSSAQRNDLTTTPTRILSRDDNNAPNRSQSSATGAGASVTASKPPSSSNKVKTVTSQPLNKRNNNKKIALETHSTPSTSISKATSKSTADNYRKDTIQQTNTTKKSKPLKNSNDNNNRPNNSDASKTPKQKKITLTSNNSNNTERKFNHPNMLMMKGPPKKDPRNLSENTIHMENMLPMGNTVLKGRQKLRPRKKRLTSLKKRVLMERLEQWHRHNPPDKKESGTATVTSKCVIEGDKDGNGGGGGCIILCLRGFVNPEELEDEDEYDEIIADLTNMANKVVGGGHDGGGGTAVVTEESSRTIITDDIYIPRSEDCQSLVGLAFLKLGRREDAIAAMDCWNHLVIGGNRLSVGLVSPVLMDEKECNQNEKKINDLDWKEMIKGMSLPDVVQSLTQETEVPTGGQANSNISSSTILASTSSTTAEGLWKVYLCNILTEDDYEDEECLEETREDIKILAGKYGLVNELRIDVGRNEMDGQTIDDVDEIEKFEVCITYASEDMATLAVQGLNGMTIGGVPIIATTQHPGKDESTMILDNILTEDDFEDQECLEETKVDILKFAGKFGHVQNIQLHLEGDQKGVVVIQYSGLKAAAIAAKELDGMLIGGNPMIAREFDHKNMRGSSNGNVISGSPHTTSTLQPRYDSILVLENILTEDDFEDEECREETIGDIKSLAGKFGSIADLKLELEGEHKGQVMIQYVDENSGAILSTAVNELNGIIIGGQQIVARQLDHAKKTVGPIKKNCNVESSYPTKDNDDAGLNIEDDPNDPKPIFSGGKKIPEQYAKCKRVPKIPTPSNPRQYASKIGDEAIPLLVDMLGELMRLQKRSKDDKNAKLRRRLVMGLREVARGIRARKVKMVIMANNLDMYGAIDSKLQEILDLAREEDVPVFFELSKRKLGKALGKSIKVAVVGVQSSDGAHNPFKQLKKLANG